MIDPISKDANVNSLIPCSDSERGSLNIVATPIGNLADISQRALRVLSDVDVILAEDTRHSKRLLNHYGITTRLKSCHEHNEAAQVEWVKAQLDQGLDLALISDAGTPLISDPGFVLVRALRSAGYRIVTVPGPSSIIAALSVAGLPTDGFVYDGFLPSKSAARKAALEKYLNQARTVVVLESSHRISACLSDIVSVLGEQRLVVLARELTKRFETVLSGEAAEVLAHVLSDDDQTRGEFVVMLGGVPEISDDQVQVHSMLTILLAELPVKQAASLVSKMTKLRKNDVYQLALEIKKGLQE